MGDPGAPNGDENANAPARHPVHVVLDNVRSAFNVGSIFRTADAALLERIHCCGITAYPPGNRLMKTALGATEFVPWTYHRVAEAALAELRAQGVTIVAVETMAGAVPHTQFVWPRPVAIVFGHEVNGIRPGVLSACDEAVCIPMLGRKNTINVATAFGVIAYEILRQWGAIPGPVNT